MTLRRYLKDKPESWFVSPLLLADIVTDRLPHLLIAEEQAENILLLKQRLRALVEKERALNVLPLSGAATEAQLALGRLLHDHFKTQQEMGLMPKAATKLDVTARGDRAHHEIFTFLNREEAAALKRLEADVAAGTIDVLELYKRAAPIFKIEQEIQARLAVDSDHR